MSFQSTHEVFRSSVVSEFHLLLLPLQAPSRYPECSLEEKGEARSNIFDANVNSIREITRRLRTTCLTPVAPCPQIHTTKRVRRHREHADGEKTMGDVCKCRYLLHTRITRIIVESMGAFYLIRALLLHCFYCLHTQPMMPHRSCRAFEDADPAPLDGAVDFAHQLLLDIVGLERERYFRFFARGRSTATTTTGTIASHGLASSGQAPWTARQDQISNEGHQTSPTK